MGLTQITTGGVDDNINIDSNTLKVDGTNNRVGIGTASADTALHVKGTASSQLTIERDGSGSQIAGIIFKDGSGDQNRISCSDQSIRFAYGSGNAESMRIDSSGRLLIGISTSQNVGFAHAVQIEGTTGGTSSMSLIRNSNDTSGPHIDFAKTRGTSTGSNTVVQSGDDLGNLVFRGADGTDKGSIAVQIQAEVDGTPGSNDMPGRLLFMTTADGASSPTERLKIDSTGNVKARRARSNTAGDVALSIHPSDTTVSYGFRIDNATNSFNLDRVDNSSALLSVDSSGRVGIGDTGPGQKLVVKDAGSATTSCYINVISGNGSANAGIAFGDTDADLRGGVLYNHSDDALRFFKSGFTEAARIDSSGRLLVGTTTEGHVNADNLTVADSANCGITIRSGISSSGNIFFSDATSGDGERRGSISYQHGDERMMFNTNATERMRINNVGDLLVGKTSQDLATVGFQYRGAAPGLVQITRSAQAPLHLNRLQNDGDLLAFFQHTSLEGTISVSGTTVSYNGAHLSRWSQLAGGAARTEILRGSVLSNLDEMCEWGEEDNEQLNRMKVSDVEGDVNVSGVFQGWHDDDDTYTNDFYCAMTGDFVIRIAQGTTVARGDLLMSAGDGTAKPQDDDIVRSKTIAKVTSTTVSTTYSDGSYCVPCVLMAC